MPENPLHYPATPTGPLTTPHAGKSPLAPEAAPPPRAGGCVILCELGRGGMGEVFEGEDEALGRRLAVKVLRLDLAGREDIERRFLAEARLTGQLQHPGVPPIHEVGTLPDGRPFFSMKLVRGRTLEALLRERTSAAGLPRMLAVFEQVCQTIGYAHSKGIIHRDLKPANVMVGEFGEVQVMDWGLAKSIGAHGEIREGPGAAAESTVFTPVSPVPDNATRAGTILGTPAYIAPEQARGQTDFLDQRADVFGLGAVLCQILTGEPPYLATGDKAVLRKAQDGDLASARARVGACGADTELVRLCLSCLAFQPSERPVDGAAVAAAVAAHRSGVEARLRQAERERAAAEARAEGEVKRRRLALWSAGLTLALLLLAGWVGGWMYLHRQRVTQAAEASLEEAERHAEEEKWRESLDAAARARDQAGDWLVAATLRRRAESAWRSSTLIAELERLQMAGAETNVALSVFDPSEALAGYRGAFAAAGWPQPGDDPAALAVRLEELGAKARARAFDGLIEWWKAGIGMKHADADWLGRGLDLCDGDGWRVEVRRAIAAKDTPALVRLASTATLDHPTPLLLGLAISLARGNEAARALAFLERLHRRHPGHLWVNVQLGHALQDANPPRYAEAARAFAAAAALRPDSAGMWLNLGHALSGAGEHEASLRADDEAVRLQPGYAVAHNNRARTLLSLGRHKEAEEAARRAIALAPDDLNFLTGLAETLIRQGRNPENEALLKKRAAEARPGTFATLKGDALAVRGDLVAACSELRKAIAADASKGGPWNNLGVAYLRDGRKLEAYASLREAVLLEPDNKLYWRNLGTALANISRPAEAEAALRRSISLDRRGTASHGQLVGLLNEQRRYADAAVVIREAISREPGKSDRWITLANTLEKAGADDEAVAAYREAARLSPGDPNLPGNAGIILCDRKKRYEEAAAAFREAIAIAPAEPTHHFNLGNALRRGGKPLEAAAAYRAALRLAPESPMAADALSNLALAHLVAGDKRAAIDTLELSSSIRRDAATLTQLARLVEEAGRADRAEWACRAAIALPGPDGGARVHLAMMLLRRGETAETEKLLDEAVAHDPKASSAWMGLGHLRGFQGRHAEAAEAFLMASAHSPTPWAPPLQERAKSLAALGRRAEVVEVRRALTRLDPKHLGYRIGLADALRQAGQRTEAAAVLKGMLAGGHDIYPVRLTLGRVYAEGGLHREALREYRHAMRLESDNCDPPFLIAQTLEKQGDHAGALEAYKAAYCRMPDSPGILKGLANSLTRAGDRANALPCWRAALAADPSDVGVREGLALALQARGELKAAIRLLEEGLKARPNELAFLAQLPVTLMYARLGPQAVEAARSCVAAHPANAHSLNVLSQAFDFNGQHLEARHTARRAAEVNGRAPVVPPEVILAAVTAASEHAALEERLPAILRGEDKPSGVQESVGLAQVCFRKGYHRAAVRLISGVRLAPGLADISARAAARLAAGRDEEKVPDEAESREAGRKALRWLASDLPALRRSVQSGPADARQRAASWVRRWLEADDFAPWRDGAAFTELPAVARSQWQCLWAEMRAVVALAEAQGL